MGRLAREDEVGVADLDDQGKEHDYQFDYEGTRPPLIQPPLGMLLDHPSVVAAHAAHRRHQEIDKGRK